MIFTDRHIFLLFLTLRLLCLYFVQSSFVPDEYWQSLEVSHKLTFGYGHLTWEWDKKIRSCFYPFVIHVLYKILPDSLLVIIYSPKLLQAILSSFGDYFAYKLAKECFGKSCGLWTAFSISTSWFLFYCSSRTLTNMAEASLTSCGFYFYPWPQRKSYRLSSKYIWFAGISAAIRPTAVVTWFPLYVWHICRERNIVLLIKNTCIIGCVIVVGMLLTDKWCYHEWVFTPYNFFLFNWSNDIGAFYGSHNFFWYFFMGLPTVLGFHLIPFLYGLMLPQLKHFYFLILWVLIVFSIPSHKEFRFLLPILHLCMIICGAVMSDVHCGKTSFCKMKMGGRMLKFYSMFLILSHASISIYMGLFHQRGVLDAMSYLSDTTNIDSNILFLMPCHSTPYYSYIHKNITMKFLTCEPNFKNEENYIEEADKFFEDPDKWLKNYEESNTAMPSHIVIFDTVYPSIATFFSHRQYKKCFSAFHSHFSQGRTGRYVFIYCK